jgi:hypothetical protein
MKHILEKIADYSVTGPASKFLFFIFPVPYVIFLCIMYCLHMCPNPVVFYGAPVFLLYYLRYKELKETHNNYTQEEFIWTYKHCYWLARNNDEYIRTKYKNLLPLAKDMLSICNKDDCDDLDDWLKEDRNIDDFINKKYLDNFKISNILISPFYIYLYIGLIIEIHYWIGK